MLFVLWMERIFSLGSFFFARRKLLKRFYSSCLFFVESLVSRVKFCSLLQSVNLRLKCKRLEAFSWKINANAFAFQNWSRLSLFFLQEISQIHTILEFYIIEVLESFHTLFYLSRMVQSFPNGAGKQYFKILKSIEGSSLIKEEGFSKWIAISENPFLLSFGSLYLNYDNILFKI